MLSFETTQDGKAIQIQCDSSGIDILLKALSRLVDSHGGHLHLRGPSAGGHDLNEVSPFGEKSFCEVMIDYTEGDPLVVE